MTQTFLVLAPTWLLLTALGWILTGLLPEPARSGLRPAAPLIGVAVPVLVLHWTTLLVGVDTGVWAVLVVAVLLAALATGRDRRWWAASRRVLLTTVAVAAVAAVPAVLALAPTLAVGDSRVVQPSANNDAFYYVTVIDWLTDHPATDQPVLAADPAQNDTPPSYVAARSQLSLHLRIGQELTQSAVNVTLHRPAVDTWYPLTCLWLFLLPAAGYGIAYLWSMRRLVGVAFGLATSVAAVTISQLAAQNSDSLLGYSLMPLALAAVVSVLGAHPRVPRWFAGVLFTAAVGSYTEFLPLIAAALVVAVLVRRPRAVLAALRSAVVVLAVAVVAAPFVWYDAVRSLLFLGGIASDNFPSAFLGVGSGAVLNRFVGAANVTQPYLPSTATPVLVTGVGIGVAAALVLSRRRWFLLTLGVVPPALAYYLVFLAAAPRPYTQQRTVQLFLPLLLLISAFGWDRLMTAVSRRRAEAPADPEAEGRGEGAADAPPAERGRPTLVTGVVVAVAVLSLAAWGLVNARSSHRQELGPIARTRNVDPSFAQAAGWVEQVGGREGSDVEVLTADFFAQLWITDALRDEVDVAYPRLYISYQGVHQYWNGQQRRYLLVDTATILAADPGVVVQRNTRFELLDLDRGRAAALTPADEFGTGNYFLLRSDDVAGPVQVSGGTVPRPAGGPALSAFETGAAFPPATLSTLPQSVTLATPGPANDLYQFVQNGLEFRPEEISLAAPTP